MGGPVGVCRQTAAAIFSSSSKGSASMSEGVGVGWLGGDCSESVEENACASEGEKAGESNMAAGEWGGAGYGRRVRWVNDLGRACKVRC